MRDGVVCHVDGGIRQAFHHLRRIPRHLYPKTVLASDGPLSHPPKCLLERVFRNRVEAIEAKPIFTAKVTNGVISPNLFHTVRQKPLVQECRNTIISRAGNHEAIRLAVYERIPGVQKLLANPCFRLLNGQASKMVRRPWCPDRSRFCRRGPSPQATVSRPWAR